MHENLLQIRNTTAAENKPQADLHRTDFYLYKPYTFCNP